MKPWKTIARARGAGSDELTLQERDGQFVIRVGGHELMSSRSHRSEAALAKVALTDLRGGQPQILIGGLGLGYTLRAALDRLPPDAGVVVAELFEAVVTWNRGPLAGLAGSPLDDPRVRVETVDVRKLIAHSSHRFHAILLDVDNGPAALTQKSNQHLYGPAGLKAARAALRPGGLLAIWSAGPDPRFLDQLRLAGFVPEERRVGKDTKHTLFLARG